ncbi:pilus assembly protein TadG-related protein [Stappia sp.]|uniref:pilus assembly protein TadG-related protein n=1 Tax=Stappia sp. TaxID=1870903 RepID=UPI003A998BD1
MQPDGLRKLFLSLARDRQGSVAMITAFFFAVIIGALALAVDVGALFLERRTLQGTADLAAVAGASDIPRAEAAVAATLEANGVDADFTVIRGNYVQDAALDHTRRFRPNLQPFNAVRVDLRKPGRVYFARVFSSQTATIGVSAMAANAELAAFSIGTRLLALRDGVANELLGKMLGTRVDLNVMDYQGLASADMQIAQTIQGVASRIDLTAGTFQDVLDAPVTIGDLVAAMAKIAGDNGDTAAELALKRLLASGGLNGKVPLGSLFDLGPLAMLAIDDPAPGLDAQASAMQVLGSSLVLANGARQVKLDLGAEVPGLLSLSAVLAIGEMPRHSAMIAVGPKPAKVRTAQTRLRLVAEVGGAGALADVRLRLPIVVDLAYGEAELASVSCPYGGSARAAVVARPGIVEAWIGEPGAGDLSDFGNTPRLHPARIVEAPLVKVTGKAHVDVGNATGTRLVFTARDVARGTVKRTGTRSIAGSLVSSLLSDLDLEVKLLSLGLSFPGPVADTVGDLLGEVAAPLDAVVHGLLTTLGLHLGEADVRVHGIRCGGGVLAG